MSRYNRLFKNKYFKLIVLLCGSILSLIIIINLLYLNRFYPNTTIDGIDVSKMSIEQANQEINSYIDSYQLTIKGRNNGSYVLKATDIDLKTDYEDKLEDVFKQSHGLFSFYKIIFGEDIITDFNVSYNQNSLKNNLSNCLLITGDNYKINAPKNAYVSYDKKTKTGKINKEQMGNKLDEEKFISYVESCLHILEDNCDLELGDVYLKPQFYQNDKLITNQLKSYNNLLYHWVRFDMGSKHYETVKPSDIKNWLIINDDASVGINKKEMANWVESFCLKYKTVGKERKFKAANGKTISVSGGDYGWRLDYDKTVNQLYTELLKENKEEDVNNYLTKTSGANKKKLLTTLKPIYKNKAYKMNYKNFEKDFDVKNYSEIDITKQMVYVFKNGKKVYSAKCVTGLPSDPTRATKTGCWYIKDKKKEYVLKGEDYETPTQYWIRITWTGTGYHYMERSDWDKWTPDLYKTKGSHGCINLQLNDVKNIYSLVSLNDIVFIH